MQGRYRLFPQPLRRVLDKQSTGCSHHYPPALHILRHGPSLQAECKSRDLVKIRFATPRTPPIHRNPQLVPQARPMEPHIKLPRLTTGHAENSEHKNTGNFYEEDCCSCCLDVRPERVCELSVGHHVLQRDAFAGDVDAGIPFASYRILRRRLI